MSGEPGAAWLHFVLEPDREHPERGPDGALLDTALRLGSRDNRVGLWRGPPSWEIASGDAPSVVDLPLRCVAHPHPECRFQWVRLMADFSASGGEILDLRPRHSAGNGASQDGGLPEIVSSGIGFPSVTWDFRPRPGQPMYLDCDLRILAAVPAALAGTELDVRFVVRAQVSVAGVVGLIPLIGRREAEYDTTA